MRRLLTLPFILAFLVSTTACRQGGAAAAKGAQTATPPVTGGAPALETDPRRMRFNRVDMLITQWDVAQAGARHEQAEALFQRVRVEVDAGYCDFESASRGQDGTALQYLGTSALGFSSRPEATRALVARLEDRDGQLLGNALIALKLRADPNTPLEPVLKHVVSPAAAPRRYAPLAIANVVEARHRRGMGTDPQMRKAALHVLSGVVADRDPYVRLHVAKALGAFRAPACYELLMILMKDNEIRIRIAAAAGLERLGDYRGFPSVIRLLGDATDEARPAVRDILASYAQRLQGAPLPPSEIARLGQNTVGWTQWFNDLCRRRGYAVDEGHASGLVSTPCQPPSAAPGPRTTTAPPRAMPPRAMPPRAMPPRTVPPRTVPPRTVPPRAVPRPPAPAPPRAVPPPPSFPAPLPAPNVR